MLVKGPAFSSHEAGQLSDDDLRACQRTTQRQPLSELSPLKKILICSLEVATMASRVHISADRLFVIKHNWQ